jgi:CspA family cold shock protein
MTQYGKITHYDAQQGTGTIAPEQGGDPLPFDRTGLQQQAQEPRSDQLYTYETQMGASGQAQAVNLQMEQGNNARQQSPDAHGNQGGFDQRGESQNHANQEAARRPGVDGQPDREARDSEVTGGSDFQPQGQSQTTSGQQSQNQRFQDQQDRNERGQNPQGQNPQGQNPQGQNQQSPGQNRADVEGVSRAGIEQPERRGPTTSSNQQHGGSTFQPLEDDQSHNDRVRQERGEPGRDPLGQNPQGQEPRGQAERPPIPPSNPARRP